MILVPLDGSALGERALPTAIALARRCGAALRLAHVREPVAYPMGGPMRDPRWDDEADRQLDDRVSWLAEHIVREEKLDAEPVLLRGEISPALVEYVASRGVDLVVMTTHGRGGFSRAWFGSVADDLVRHALVPVLLIRPDAEQAPGIREPLFSRVLVPFDGSSRADDVLMHAAALGTPGATEFLLLTVITARVAVDPFPTLPVMLDRADLARLLEDQRLRASTHLGGMAHSLQEIGAHVSTHTIVHRAPAAAILEFAEQHAADLIVLSTRVRSATERALIGSVADKVLRGAAAPVLVCGPRFRSVVASSAGEASATVSGRAGLMAAR